MKHKLGSVKVCPPSCAPACHPKSLFNRHCVTPCKIHVPVFWRGSGWQERSAPFNKRRCVFPLSPAPPNIDIVSHDPLSKCSQRCPSECVAAI